MKRFHIYRYGSNAANQSMKNGPVQVATVRAETEDEALSLARRRVSVYNNQFLEARDAENEDAAEAEIDSRFE